MNVSYLCRSPSLFHIVASFIFLNSIWHIEALRACWNLRTVQADHHFAIVRGISVTHANLFFLPLFFSFSISVSSARLERWSTRFKKNLKNAAQFRVSVSVTVSTTFFKWGFRNRHFLLYFYVPLELFPRKYLMIKATKYDFSAAPLSLLLSLYFVVKQT